MILTGPSIHLYQLMAQRAAVRLEAKGFKHSNGNVTPKLKKHYGIKSRGYRELLERLDMEIMGFKDE